MFGSPALRKGDSPALKDISLSSDDGSRVINDDVTN